MSDHSVMYLALEAELDRYREQFAAAYREWQALVEERTAERDRYRGALRLIAGQNSGVWGRIAHEALTGKRQADSDASTPDTSQT